MNVNCLVIDTDQSVQKSISRQISRLGCRRYVASNSNDSIDILSSHEIDIIFADYDLPDSGAFEFFKKIAAMERAPLVLYVMCKFLPDNLQTPQAQGKFGVVTKPLNDQTVEDIIRMHFSGRQAPT